MSKQTKNKLIKVGKGALIALSGALAVYLGEVAGTFDFGTWTPMAVAVASILANALRLFSSRQS